MIRSTMIAALAAASMLAAPAMAAQDSQPTRTKGEQELAKLLEGRVAGEPQRCVRTLSSDNFNVIDGTAIVIGRGRTIYVNIPRDPTSLDDSDVLVIRKQSGSHLCRLDWVETRERFGGFYNGNIMLSDFVPYTRAEDGAEPDASED